MTPRNKWHTSLTRFRIFEASNRRLNTLADPGFCLACGTEHADCTNAHGAPCGMCWQPQVYGCEELLMEVA